MFLKNPTFKCFLHLYFIPAPPHITDALDQLRSMGFDDEGGWLTHLVEAKGGDLNRILDTIRLNP